MAFIQLKARTLHGNQVSNNDTEEKGATWANVSYFSMIV